MSGGSFDYASRADDIASVIRHQTKLDELANELMVQGAFQAAIDTLMVIQLAKKWNEFVENECAKLGDIWHALEWWKSRDYNEQQFRDAVDRYKLR